MKLGSRSYFSAVVSLVALGMLIVFLSPRGGLAQVNTQPGGSQQSSAAESILAIVGTPRAGLYDAPNGEPVRTMAAGAVLNAVGRTPDSQWLVATTDDGAVGWVQIGDVVIFGAQQLPIMMDVDGNGEVRAPDAEPIQLPTVTPTPSPTATPTSTPTPLHTATPTQTPTPLPTATYTPAPQATISATPGQPANSIVAVVRGGGAQLLAEPDGDAGIALNTGVALSAVARTQDGSKLYVLTTAGEAGWVDVARVVAFNTEALPVAEPGSGSGDLGIAEAGADLDPLPSGAQADDGDGNITAEAAPGTPSMTARVALSASRLNIRGGPGTAFAIIGKAEPGNEYRVRARSADSAWLLVDAPAVDVGFGWVAAEFVTLSGALAELPVSNQVAPASAPAVESGLPLPTPTPISVLRAQPLVRVPTAAPATVAIAAGGLSGRLAFQSVPGETIYVYDFATGQVRALPGGYDPAISPTGSTIAFTRWGGEHGLYLMNVDGGNVRLIFGGGESFRGPAWSPDGEYIAFTRTSGAERCRDVGFSICLPDNPFLSDFPLVSRNRYGLSRVDVNGENFNDIPALNSVQAPNWTANGIVYQSNAGIERTADEPDATSENLAQSPFFGSPKWRPVIGAGTGGDRIVFHSRQGSHWQVFAMRPDGNNMVALTRPQTTLVDELPSNVNPVWSPNGQHIAFLSNRAPGPDGTGPWRIWVMDADGGNQRPLGIDVPVEFSFNPAQMLSWGR